MCIKLSACLIPCSAPNRSAPAAGLAASRPLRGWPDMESPIIFHGKTGNHWKNIGKYGEEHYKWI